MSLKRALFFGLIFWIMAFVIISILMFSPWFKESEIKTQIGWWIIEIPVVLLLAKWYFKADPPSIKKGFLLGIIALVVGTILDMIITVPLFVKSYSAFYGSWTLYVGFAELLVLTTFAGFEFDRTYTKREKEKAKAEDSSASSKWSPYG